MVEHSINYPELVRESCMFAFPDIVERQDIMGELPVPALYNLVHIITGIRRSGKTFYLFQLIKRLLASGISREKIFYFNFADDRLRPAPHTLLSDVVEEYWRQVPEARREGCYLFLDEVQEGQDWQSFCQRVAEHERVTLVITGSSSKLSADDIATQFRGRSQEHVMYPLSFREYCKFHQIELPERDALKRGAISSLEKTTLESAYDRYLLLGGFPGVQHLSFEDRLYMLQSYARDVVARDVVERHGRLSISLATQVSLFALRNTGCDLSINKLVDALKRVGYKTSWETVNEMVHLFVQAHLVSLLPEYTTALSPDSTTIQKVYACDSGMAYATARANQQDLGKRLETAVYTDLVRASRGSRMDTICSFTAKTSAREKVDFLVGDALTVDPYQLIQVSVDMSAQKTRSREVGSLAVAMQQTNLSAGNIVTLREEGKEEVDDGREITIIPAWKWSLLQS